MVDSGRALVDEAAPVEPEGATITVDGVGEGGQGDCSHSEGVVHEVSSQAGPHEDSQPVSQVHSLSIILTWDYEDEEGHSEARCPCPPHL